MRLQVYGAALTAAAENVGRETHTKCQAYSHEHFQKGMHVL